MKLSVSSRIAQLLLLKKIDLFSKYLKTKPNCITNQNVSLNDKYLFMIPNTYFKLKYLK